MLIETFVNMLKDYVMIILSVISTMINTLFNMPIFWDGTTYIISVGHILFACITFSIIFGFIFSTIGSKFGGRE